MLFDYFMKKKTNDEELLDSIAADINILEAQLAEMAKTGYDDTVVAIAKSYGMAPGEYNKSLRIQRNALQRKYNSIISEEKTGRTPYIVDSFDENYWKNNKVAYTMLEPVEINIDRRLSSYQASPSMYNRIMEIGQTNNYVFYYFKDSFLRKDKNTGETVYFGHGEEPAVLYGNWLYWYEFGALLSDKFIYRRSIDGLVTEMLDWLSNKKTIDVSFGYAHEVSEDHVIEMFTENNMLIIRVRRLSEDDAVYRINVIESNGDLFVNKKTESGDIAF